jgi:hypothetical protein
MVVFKYSNTVNVVCLFFLFTLNSQTTTFISNHVSSSNVNNVNNALGNNSNTFTQINSRNGLCLLQTTFSGQYNASFSALNSNSDPVFFHVSSNDNLFSPLVGGTLSNLIADVFGVLLTGNHTVNFSVLNNGVIQKTISTSNTPSNSSYRVVQDVNQDFYVRIPINVPYNQIRVVDNTSPSLLSCNSNSVRLHRVFFHQDLNCDILPLYTDFDGSGLTSELINLGSGVNNLTYAIDDDYSTHSSLNLGVINLSSSIQQNLYYPNSLHPNASASIKISINPSLISLGLLNNIDFIAYDKGQMVHQVNLNSILNVDLLGLLMDGTPTEIPYKPGVSFDQISIRLNSLLNVNISQTLNLFGVKIKNAEVKTKQVQNLSPHLATLKGELVSNASSNTINPIGFELSLDSDFSNPITYISSFLNFQEFDFNLSDLIPETEYYYRAFITNSCGIFYGEEFSFVTPMITWSDSWNNYIGPIPIYNARIASDANFNIPSFNLGQQEIEVKNLYLDANFNLQNAKLTINESIITSNESKINALNGVINFKGNIISNVCNASIFVNNTIYTLHCSVSNQLYINGNLDITNLLKVNSGNIQINHFLTFKSSNDCDKTAFLDTVPISSLINGNVIVERCFRAKRAFRFITSSVTTSSSIRDNWQEGVNNSSINVANYHIINQNPNPGYGTHISGSFGSTAGFDVTATNNPSLFIFNNSINQWTPVNNTINNSLIAGFPYRIALRGDRSINLNFNNTPPTPTILRSTGSIFIGDYILNGASLNQNPGGYSLIGNPYQCPINVEQILDDSYLIDQQYYYSWDPNTSNNQGSYVLWDRELQENNVTGSTINNFVQPGQAFFIRKNNVIDSAIVTIKESHKNVNEQNNQVFKLTKSNIGKVNVQLVGAFDNISLDGVIYKFKPSGDNIVNEKDALKFSNFDEDIAIRRNGINLSIEDASIPLDQDEIPLFLTKYRNFNYVLKIHYTNPFSSINAFLFDSFLQNYIPLSLNTWTNYSFNVNVNNDSSNSSRFKIIFSSSTLNHSQEGVKKLTVFPNPSNGKFNIQLSSPESDTCNVFIYNSSGKLIVSKEYLISNGLININEYLTKGLYLIKVTNHQSTYSGKITVE